jgi:hypothetical protein
MSPTATTPKWVTVWKFDWRKWPEKVRVLKVTDNYWIEEGSEHTNYKGGYFETPEAAFDHEAAELERRIKSLQRDKEQLVAKRESFFKKHRRSS